MPTLKLEFMAIAMKNAELWEDKSRMFFLPARIH